MQLKIRQARESAGLTQQQLAVASGLTMRTISYLEAGRDPRVSTLARIAMALRISLDELVELGDDLGEAA